jgi:hypothetical protein
MKVHHGDMDALRAHGEDNRRKEFLHKASVPLCLRSACSDAGVGAPARGVCRSARLHITMRKPLAACVVLLFLPLSGCLNVPSVAGRTAAVLPGGSEHLVMGAGVGGVAFEDSATGDSGTDVVAVPHFSLMLGLGDRFDCQMGANGFQGFLVLRRQIAGDLQGKASRSRFDASLEVGASVSSSATFRALRIGPYDVHLGVNLSFPGRSVVPYVTYRYHWASRSYWEWGEWLTPQNWVSLPPSWPSGVEEGESFRQEMLFVGVEFPAPSSAGAFAAVEIYFGRPSRLGRIGAKKTEEVAGINVVISHL